MFSLKSLKLILSFLCHIYCCAVTTAAITVCNVTILRWAGIKFHPSCIAQLELLIAKPCEQLLSKLSAATMVISSRFSSPAPIAGYVSQQLSGSAAKLTRGVYEEGGEQGTHQRVVVEGRGRPTHVCGDRDWVVQN